MSRCNPRNWSFDIDRFLNPFVPAPPWKYLPYPIAHFLGYRKTKPDNVGNLVPTFWACIGVFCGVAVVAKISHLVPSFREHGAPIIVGSFVSWTFLSLTLISISFYSGPVQTFTRPPFTSPHLT